MASLRKVAEARYSSREEVLAFTREAIEIADELDLTPEDRAALLPQLVILTSQRQLQYELVQFGEGALAASLRG